MTPRVMDRDHGYKALRRQVARMGQGSRIAVGVVGDATIMMKAMVAEFGTEMVPERSFLRSWFDQHRGRLQRELRAATIGILRSRSDIREAVLVDLAQRWAAEVRENLLRGVGPALKPATIRHKEAMSYQHPETPNVGSGQLLEAIVGIVDGAVVT